MSDFQVQKINKFKLLLFYLTYSKEAALMSCAILEGFHDTAAARLQLARTVVRRAG